MTHRGADEWEGVRNATTDIVALRVALSRCMAHREAAERGGERERGQVTDIVAEHLNVGWFGDGLFVLVVVKQYHQLLLSTLHLSTPSTRS
jgi:hypothetical protein